MDQKEKFRLIQSSRKLQEREKAPVIFDDPYSDMTSEEKSKLIIYLQQLVDQSTSKLDAMLEAQNRAASALAEANNQIATLTQLIVSKDAAYTQVLKDKEEALKDKEELLQTIQALTEQLKVMRQEKYGSKSHKRSKSKSGGRDAQDDESDRQKLFQE